MSMAGARTPGPEASRDRHRIVVLDRNPAFALAASFLWAMTMTVGRNT